VIAQQPPGPPSTSSPAWRSMRISIPAVVIGLAMLGSIAFIGYVVMQVDDGQIPLLAAGVVVLGASFAAIGVWSLVEMWKSASRARLGRALGLAVLGGLAALGAIGCFTVAALAALVWNT
jgi:hypothetical protein